MLTFAQYSATLFGPIAALRQSWLAALGGALLSAFGALLLGPAAIDPAWGVRR
jgi:hypothetical protein